MEPTSAINLDAKPLLDTSHPDSSRVLLVFQLADRFAALLLQQVERIVPMAELASPPGLPSALEGILNLAGLAIPVLRLDRLFKLPAQRVGLYSMLVILRAPHEGRFAILVDQISEIASVPDGMFLPIDGEDSFNGCAEAAVLIKNQTIHLLSPTRMLQEKERGVLAEFQRMSQQRLQECEGPQA